MMKMYAEVWLDVLCRSVCVCVCVCLSLYLSLLSVCLLFYVLTDIGERLKEEGWLGEGDKEKKINTKVQEDGIFGRETEGDGKDEGGGGGRGENRRGGGEIAGLPLMKAEAPEK